MNYLAATLHILGATLTDKAQTTLKTNLSRDPNPGGRTGRDADKGAVTMEMVIWAVAIIGIVGIVVAAITSYVTSKAAGIR